MNDQCLEALGKKAFALTTGVSPEEVTFEKGLFFHKCRWEGGGKIIEGNFYHWFYHDENSGIVHITMELTSEKPHCRLPSVRHHVWGVNAPTPIISTLTPTSN